MNIKDVQSAAWNVRRVVNFLRTIPIGSVKSTHQLADEFIESFGVDGNDSGFYGVLNNMCAAFDYLHSLGDISIHRTIEGMPVLTFKKNSGFSPN